MGNISSLQARDFDPFVVSDDEGAAACHSNGKCPSFDMTMNSECNNNSSFDGFVSPFFETNFKNKPLSNRSNDIETFNRFFLSSSPSLKTSSLLLLINVVLNEDLTCSYQQSKLSSCSVEGVIQTQVKTDSSKYFPFVLTLQDSCKHISALEENKEYARKVSLKLHSPYHQGNSIGKYKFIINVPKCNIYFPVVRYKCSNQLRPVPIRIQTRIRVHEAHCRVAIQISSNPENERELTDLSINMSIPSYYLKSETLKTQPPCGVWNESKGSVLWCVTELHKGEKCQLQAQFELNTPFINNNIQPTFPVWVQCQSLYTQLSNIDLELSELSINHHSSGVIFKLARRFRVSHSEKP